MKIPASFPEKIDLLKQAELGFNWQGDVPLVRFARLNEVLEREPNPASTLEISATLHKTDSKLPWLKGSAKGTVTGTCQRCLEAIDVDVDAELDLAVLTEEMFIERLNADQDYVLLDAADFGGADGRTFPKIDLLALIEDEVLVSLPLAIKHDDCEHVNPEFVVEEFIPMEIEEEPRENPFDVLAALKNKN